MKTVYGHICEGCETVRTCSQMGCRPIEKDTKRKKSLLDNDWIFWPCLLAPFFFGLGWALADLLLSGWKP